MEWKNAEKSINKIAKVVGGMEESREIHQQKR